MVIVRQKSLGVMFLAILLLTIAAVFIQFTGSWLVVHMRMGEFPLDVDILSAISPEKLQQYTETLVDLARNSAITGSLIATLLASILIYFRLRNEKDHAYLDERFVAITILVVWYVIFNIFYPVNFGDETANQNAIDGIYYGDWSYTQVLAVVPGYHWFIAKVSGLFGPSLLLTRTCSLIMSSIMLLLYFDIAKKWKPGKAGNAVISLTLLPILLPYTSTAYTDAPALFLVIGAVWALTRRRYNISAVFMLLACFVRQSNLVWIGFMVMLAGRDLWKEYQLTSRAPKLVSKEFILTVCARHLYGYGFAVLVFMLSIFFMTDDLIWGHDPTPLSNRPRPNMGNLYSVLFFILLFWAPMWLGRISKDILALRHAAMQSFTRTGGVALVLVLSAAALIVTYDNFHPWNQPFIFITNIPLVLMADNVSIRILGILAMYWAMWVILQTMYTQPHRVELALVAIFFAIFMLPHALVDPRYYFVAFALFHLFLEYSPKQEARLVIWWLVISSMIGMAMIIGHLRYTTISW